MPGWLAFSVWLAWFDPSGSVVADARARATFPSTIDTGWIRTPLLAGEDLARVAARHGVTEAELRQWNPKAGRDLERGDVVQVRVRADAPVLQPIYASVQEDDTWAAIAERYGVSVSDVLASNPELASRKRPARGTRLTLWVSTRVRRLPVAAPPTALPEIEVTSGGLAVGKPHRGRLEHGVRLPDSDLYTIRFDRLCYGTTLAVHDIQQAIGVFRHETGFDGEVFIGAMSRRSGRKLSPHRSHRTGRDADIRMPALPFAEGKAKLQRDEIDWSATWALVDAFVRTGHVRSIFLERKLWERLRRGAMRAGATDTHIERAFDVIKHSKGHTSHIHVRFVCSPEATECRD